MGPEIKIIYLEYIAGDAGRAHDTLKSAGISCEILVIGNTEQYIGALSSFTPNLILSDDALPGLNSIEALDLLKQNGLSIPLIVVTDLRPETYTSAIVNIMKQGAYDYILRENIDTLPDAVNSVIKKHRAETKTLQSEQRYRQIVETAQEGIWIIDENLLTIFVNKKMGEMLGYTIQEMLGRHNYDFKEKGDKTPTVERIRKGVKETHESTFVAKNGEKVIFSVATNGLYHPDGRFIGRLAMMTDITQRKTDEATLKRSEANLSAIIENTTDLVYSLNTELQFITFNQVFKTTIKAVYNFDVEQYGSVLQVINQLNDEMSGKWKKIYAKALRGETMQFVNEYDNGPDKVYLSYSINPIWETGRVIGLSCFSRNITQQKMDEAAIRRSEVSLRTIFNNTDMACMLIDHKGNILSFNTLAQKFVMDYSGKTIAEGSPVMAWVDAASRDFVWDTLSQVKKGSPVNYQMSREVNGNSKWFDLTWAGINDQEHLDFGFIFTCKDITEKKKLELEREKITTDLMQRNKALEQFTYIISHNLRAPVANIIGLSSIISDLEDADENSRAVSSISQSAYKLDEVISDLNVVLQVNKSINESVELILLPELIKDIEFSIKHLIEKEKVTIHCDFTEASHMLSLKSFMYSIFYNLILNSIKYHNPGVAPAINISTKVQNDKISIYYKDNGRGIDTSKYADQIFGLYKRFDTSVEGKGMGLFMVKMQVESMGGQISLRSALKKGTEFTLEFPITPADTVLL